MADASLVAAASDAWCRKFLGARGLAPDLVEQPGVTVVAAAGRAGSGVASAYMLGPHVVVFTDPACAPTLAGFDIDRDGDATAAYRAFVEGEGAEVLGTGVQRTLVGPRPDAACAGHPVRVQREDPQHVVRLNALFDQCTEDELEDAAIERDELDPVIYCTEASPGGQLTAYASAFPDDDFAGEWDIGVLTSPTHRHQGLGLSCVMRLCDHLLAEGEVPLYRHDIHNTASAALATAAGFHPVSLVTAARFGPLGE